MVKEGFWDWESRPSWRGGRLSGGGEMGSVVSTNLADGVLLLVASPSRSYDACRVAFASCVTVTECKRGVRGRHGEGEGKRKEFRGEGVSDGEEGEEEVKGGERLRGEVWLGGSEVGVQQTSSGQRGALHCGSASLAMSGLIHIDVNIFF